MNIQTFIHKTPYLYHLTAAQNIDSIFEQKRLFSTVGIVNMAGMENGDSFLKNRRPQHAVVKINEKNYHIRDQRPLNKALEKCLTDDWTTEQYIYHLNDRVFTWPTLKRLRIHYGRYENENPVILRFETGRLLQLNPHAEITHINSGATRPSGALGGKAASRGRETFKSFEDFDLSASKVAEVTFRGYCDVPEKFWTSNSPDGNWTEINLT